MQKEILNSFEETVNEFLQTILLFTQDQFNQIPFEGSWTAAQVSEHILKSITGIPAVLKSNPVIVERPSDAKVETLRSIFLNFDTKMKSPAFIIPADGIQQRDSLFEGLKTTAFEIKKTAAATDLTQAFPDFPLPQMGELTGLEWINFVTFHIKRHSHQLKGIHEKLV